MTPADHDPLLDDEPLDEDTLAVHAVVDDEATPEQRRRVARDPALVAQVAALRATVAAVAEPVAPPGGDVLAALRARALDTALSADVDDEAPADEPDAAEPYAAAPPAPPVRDLGQARARRARRLPPLPAVAAVVILLVLVGVGLLVSGGGTDDDQAGGAGGGDALTATEGDDSETGGQSAESAANDDAGPSGEFQDRLLAAAIARYDDEGALLDELRRVDPDTLALSGANVTDGPSATTAPNTTTTSLPGTDGEGETTTTEAEVDLDARAAAAYAATSDVQRCDSVLRSAEPDLGPVVAAVLVDVDGIPVLVLSNPTEASDGAPAGVRLTVLNAVDCSPRAAVVR